MGTSSGPLQPWLLLPLAAMMLLHVLLVMPTYADAVQYGTAQFALERFTGRHLTVVGCDRYYSVLNQKCFPRLNNNGQSQCVSNDAKIITSSSSISSVCKVTSTGCQPVTPGKCCDGSTTGCYACTEGDKLEATATLVITSTAATRYKVSAWLGNPWVDNANQCTVASLNPSDPSAFSDGTCCGGIQQNKVYTLSNAKVQFTCGTTTANQCGNQKITYALTWDQVQNDPKCNGNPCCVQRTDTAPTPGLSWVMINAGTPKCDTGDWLLPNLISKPPNPITITKTGPVNPPACSADPCPVTQGANFYWLVNVEVKSGETVQYVTMTDTGLQAGTAPLTAGARDVTWTYKATGGSAGAPQACSPAVTPSPGLAFSCKTTGPHNAGIITFKIPAQVLPTAQPGTISNTAKAEATKAGLGSVWDPISDDASITVVAATAPTISVSKTAFVMVNGVSTECATPCNLPASTTSLTYRLTGKVETPGTGSSPGVATLTLTDTIPTGMSVTATQCTATKSGGGGGCTCTQTGNVVTCAAGAGPWLGGDKIVADITVSISGAGPFSNGVLATATAVDTNVPSIPDQQKTHTSTLSVVTTAPTISVSKTAFITVNGVSTECANPCSLPASTTSLKYTLTGKVETPGTGSSPGVATLTLTDTIPTGMSVTVTQCTATKAGGGGGCTCTPGAGGAVACSTDTGTGTWLQGDQIVAEITVSINGAGPFTNAVLASGTAVDANVAIANQQATHTSSLSVNPPPVNRCDAGVTKTITGANPVFFGTSSQPPTTTVQTTVTVEEPYVCDSIVFTNRLQYGLEISGTPVASGGGQCTIIDTRNYQCVWPMSTTGPKKYTVDSVIAVVLQWASAPKDLEDTAELNQDLYSSNNLAKAIINVKPAGKPELSIIKAGPTSPVPVNKEFTYTVSAVVTNGVTITELSLVETLPAGSGAYFVAPYPDGCTPVAGDKPTTVNCKWTGSTVGGKNNLRFTVVATREGVLLDTATVSSPGADDKTATATTGICDATCPLPPTVKVTKTVDTNGKQYVDTNQDFTYTVTPELTGGDADTQVAVFDYVDQAVTFTSVSPTAGCKLTDHAVTCTVASKTAITIKAKASSLGTFVNTAEATVGGKSDTATASVTVWRSTCGDVTFGGDKDPYTGCPDGTYDPNSADKYPPGKDTCCDLTPQDVPTVKIIKTSSTDEVSPGQTVDWTISVTNEVGLTPVAAQSVQVVDTFPSGVRPIPSSVTITSTGADDKCTFSGNTMTCSLGTMPAGSIKVIKVSVTVLQTSSTSRKKLTNTASVTCSTNGKPNPGCSSTASDDIFVVPSPPQTVAVKVLKTASPQSGPKGTQFTFAIELQPDQTGKAATNVVLTDQINKDLTNVKILSGGARCKFDQATYILKCTWARLTSKQTVRISVTGVKPGAVINTAVVTFKGGQASSSADITINAEPLGSCCDGSYKCYDGISQADCKAKGSNAIWSDWSAKPPVTCGSSTFCKGACCSSGVGNCNCPLCRQTAKDECANANDKWVPGGDCNNPKTCPSQCFSKCQPCNGPSDTSCCPGLACVCSGSKTGSRYVCAQVNPWGQWDKWTHWSKGKPGVSAQTPAVKSDLLAPLGGICGRVAAGLQCAGPNVDCVLDGKSEAGRCMRRNTLKKVGQSCTGHGQCVGGCRCLNGRCRQATCPATNTCSISDWKCQVNYTFGCQVYYAHTMSSFDEI